MNAFPFLVALIAPATLVAAVYAFARSSRDFWVLLISGVFQLLDFRTQYALGLDGVLPAPPLGARSFGVLVAGAIMLAGAFVTLLGGRARVLYALAALLLAAPFLLLAIFALLFSYGA